MSCFENDVYEYETFAYENYGSDAFHYVSRVTVLSQTYGTAAHWSPRKGT